MNIGGEKRHRSSTCIMLVVLFSDEKKADVRGWVVCQPTMAVMMSLQHHMSKQNRRWHD